MEVVLPLVMVRPGLPFVVELRPAGKGAGAGMACTAAMTATTAAAEKTLPNMMGKSNREWLQLLRVVLGVKLSDANFLWLEVVFIRFLRHPKTRPLLVGQTAAHPWQ